MIESGEMSASQAEAMQKYNEYMFHKSNYSFLNQQNGWRDGELHVLLGAAGSGKSTFIRSIIYDFLLSNPEKKILIYLSEETTEQFKLQFSYTGALAPMTRRIRLFSEMAVSPQKMYEPRNVNGKLRDVFILYEKFFKAADEEKPDLILIDNFTTSQGYQDVFPSEQGKIVSRTKRKAGQLACPIIAVVHTNKGVSRFETKLLDDTNVRGSGSMGNYSEFFYTIQRITDKNTDTPVTFLQTIKHRSQAVENNFYRLIYSKGKRMFLRDQPENYSQILEILKNAAK